MAASSGPIGPNRLIGALPDGERDRVVRAGKHVRLTADQLAARRYEPLCDVLFPLTGMIALVMIMRDGSMVEIATIGREGMVGGRDAHHPDISLVDAIVPVESEALRIPASRFGELLAETRTLPQLVQRFSEALLRVLAQNVACNRLHATEQRLSRWLLTAQDRIEGDQLAVTQEFLGGMLGVRRPSVTEVVADLEQRGLIRHRRGQVTLLDRAGLEAATCECYAQLRCDLRGLYAW